jgi:NhaP-type Na+/H+ or K+/H+ antiporter
MTTGLAVTCILIAVYAALAVKLGQWSITMPMVCVLVGFVLGPGATGLLSIAPGTEGVKALTELTLTLILFADASTLDLRKVSQDASLPLRLLGIGLPLTILLGALMGLFLAPGQGFAFVFLLAAILAPTDAALGLPIFNNPMVPMRIRQALNVESGLNDGIATPFVTLFLAFAVATELQWQNGWLVGSLIAIVVAVVIGALIGRVGGWLLVQTAQRGWTGNGTEQIAILGLALAAYFTSLALNGNGFIAAFVGGIVFGASTRNRFTEQTEFVETAGSFLSLLVWGIFGAILLPVALQYTSDWRPFAYAVLSLTVVRMLPVAIALLRTGLRPDTVALMGWFGPRGLASVVFTLIAFAAFNESGRPVDTLVSTAVWSILLSVLLHGLSAVPLSKWYGARLATASNAHVELAETTAMHARHTIW